MSKSIENKMIVALILTIILSIFVLPIMEVSAATKECSVSGCHKKRWNGALYCSTHQCVHSGCGSKRVSGSSYCAKHKKELYSSSKSNKSSSSSKNSKNTYSSSYNNKKRSSSSSKKYEMPDCDDYENYGDFMDDWDGCMPDGSDAEDYWENW